jgi:hypothetical protein
MSAIATTEKLTYAVASLVRVLISDQTLVFWDNTGHSEQPIQQFVSSTELVQVGGASKCSHQNALANATNSAGK